MLEQYNKRIPCTDIFVRGDSDFAIPEVYDTCESNNSYYIIRIKVNRNLTKLAESFILIGDDYH